jgi:transcriptional regulator with XRE-family HTH domain
MSLTEKISGNQEPESETVGERIVHAREAAGLSTAQLARRAGVLTKTLQAWELDQLLPRGNQFVKLAGILNVSPTWLWVERGDSPSDEMTSTELENLQESLSFLRGRLLSVIDGLERLERRLEKYESYRA